MSGSKEGLGDDGKRGEIEPKKQEALFPLADIMTEAKTPLLQSHEEPGQMPWWFACFRAQMKLLLLVECTTDSDY